MNIASTLGFSAIAGPCWDAIVVGAGPAGSLAAREIAKRGSTVLLVDRAAFPRWKVCGCCLNVRALAALASAGMGDLTARCGAVPTTELRLSANGASASIRLSGAVALSRESLDNALVEAAVSAGARFAPETSAVRLDDDASRSEHGSPLRTVRLRRGDEEIDATTRLVVIADGLNGRLLDDATGDDHRVAESSRFGAGAVIDEAPDFFAAGTIFMACGRGGYVGLTRREDGRLTAAAAFDRELVRNAGGLGRAAAETLAETNWPALAAVETATWRGTPPLTRSHPRLAGQRVFALGDATGYVEPFTGEGMAWALTGALALTPLALRAIDRWEPSLIGAWTRLHRRVVGRRQGLCRLVAWTLRSPWRTRNLVRLLSWAPALSRPFIHYINAVEGSAHHPPLPAPQLPSFSGKVEAP